MSANNQPITFGDLVRVKGYGNRVFQVESFREETHYWLDGTMSELVYELFDCGNADSLEADAEDLTLVADASQADEYLSANPAPIEPTIFPSFGIDMSFLYGDYEGGDEMKSKEPRKPTARELSGMEAERRKQARKERAARIDELLDERSDVKALVVNFGDKTREYAERIVDIDRELAELVSDGK